MIEACLSGWPLNHTSTIIVLWKRRAALREPKEQQDMGELTLRVDFVMISDADGEPVLVNPSLVRFVVPAGEGNRNAMIVFDDAHKLYVKGTITEVGEALTIEPD